jgi:Tfp pilus assembly protein PilV
MNTNHSLADRSDNGLGRFHHQRPRRGITMLEVIIAGSMLAMVMTSLSVVLRTSRVAWEANDEDYGSMHHAHAVTRHLVRQSREASSVAAIAANELQLRMNDGSTLTWKHLAVGPDARPNVVMVTSSATGTESALAYDIRNLTFTGYMPDGLTQTKLAEDVRLIEIKAEVLLSRGSGSVQTVASKVWIRSW